MDDRTPVHDCNFLPSSRTFREGLAIGELRLQRCADCATIRHPPAMTCAKCGSSDWTVVVPEGHGKIYSWVIPREPKLPDTADRTVVLVELKEKVRILGNINASGTKIDMGTAVQFSGVDNSGEYPIPIFQGLVRD